MPIKKLFIVMLLIALPGCDSEPEKKTAPDINETVLPAEFDLTWELNNLVLNPSATSTDIPGIQMILIKNGEIIFEHAVGWARIDENDTALLTNDHKVRVASISKLVLTIGFMTLVEDGLVDLDEDVSTYLGFDLRNPNFPDQAITARQLLSHTSSIRDGSHYFMGLDGDFRDFFRPGDSENSAYHYENGAHFARGKGREPGAYFTYSNLNFGILSGIIENVSKTRMDLFIKEKLFDPLGINATFSVCTLAKDGYADLATLYRRGQGGETWSPNGPWIPQVDDNPVQCYYESGHFARNTSPDLTPLDQYTLGQNPTLFSPQGGLRASSKDLAILMQLMMQQGKWKGSQILAESSVEQMLDPVWQYDQTRQNGHTGGESIEDDQSAYGMMTSYGLSTHIIDLKDWGLSEGSKRLYGHLGSAYGLQGQFWYDPITNDGFVAFITGIGDDPSKSAATIPLYAIEEAILRLGLKGLEDQ